MGKQEVINERKKLVAELVIENRKITFLMKENKKLVMELALANKALIATQIQAEQLETILENTTAGVVVADANGNMLRMNPAALRLHGFSSWEEHANFKDFSSDCEITSLDGKPIPPEETAIAKAFRGENFSDCVMCVYRKDIELRWTGSSGRIHEANIW